VTVKIIALLASASLATTGSFAVSATRAADVLPGAPSAFMADGNDGGEKCRVEVVRTASPGAADVTRSVLANNRCVCIITTGPKSNNGSAEAIVDELLKDRTCDGAPPAGNTGAGQTAGSGGAASGGGASGGVLGGLLGAVAVGGLAAGLGGKSKG
jgi:hypothetical protein